MILSSLGKSVKCVNSIFSLELRLPASFSLMVVALNLNGNNRECPSHLHEVDKDMTEYTSDIGGYTQKLIKIRILMSNYVNGCAKCDNANLLTI